eukprot:TRINITY_DN5753_c0_g1_i1.p3 TRINITY_DN5753_c0_g1~~TRINITY_DN5753_c0_g1_i1.p3  ORF type:complete len:170 (-),score=13.28 TRINITY_DN5753_c0_g1_i1:531-1040(-)
MGPKEASATASVAPERSTYARTVTASVAFPKRVSNPIGHSHRNAIRRASSGRTCGPDTFRSASAREAATSAEGPFDGSDGGGGADAAGAGPELGEAAEPTSGGGGDKNGLVGEGLGGGGGFGLAAAEALSPEDDGAQACGSDPLLRQTRVRYHLRRRTIVVGAFRGCHL